MRILTIVFAALVLFVLAGLLFVGTKQPKEEGAWMPEQSRTATAYADGTMITLYNVRDWTYNEEQVLSDTWSDVTVDSTKITRTWFLIEPFSAIEAIGHTFLSFEFEDGTVLSFSVEAKREQGEEYSALKGQFREYELSYQWGTERDFVTRRLIYLDHPLRLYPLTLSQEDSQALFRSLAEETTALAEHPRFYNTLTANCTNVLAKIVNTHYPGTLPYDISWNLTGYADRYLMKEGLIEMSGSQEHTQSLRDLTPHKETVRALSLTPAEAFSASIRTLLSEPR